nr:hypothetical protein [Tanacetum cinerariifolium]
MNKNKVDSGQQFAEMMRVLKTLQSATTTVTVTTTPPHPTQSLPGYPIPTGPMGNDSGPFSAGEYGNGQNHMASVSIEGGKGVAANPPNEVGGGVPRTSTGAIGAETGKTPFKRMTGAEIADKRAKGFQNRTTRDYVTTFEKMAAKLPGLQEEVYEGIFIKGTKPDLRVAVRTQKPVGVRQAIKLALLIDEGGKGVAANPPNEVGGGVLRTLTGGTGAEIGKTLFKRMTEADMANKRVKGLCYRCDGTFGPRHRCPEKALQVLWVGEDEDEEEEGDSFFHLEDKVVFQGEGDDMNLFLSNGLISINY